MASQPKGICGVHTGMSNCDKIQTFLSTWARYNSLSIAFHSFAFEICTSTSMCHIQTCQDTKNSSPLTSPTLKSKWVPHQQISQQTANVQAEVPHLFRVGRHILLFLFESQLFIRTGSLHGLLYLTGTIFRIPRNCHSPTFMIFRIHKRFKKESCPKVMNCKSNERILQFQQTGEFMWKSI